MLAEKEDRSKARGNLILSRRIGEVIRIGDDIEVTVVDIDRGKVRLSFIAPLDVPILRSELVAEDREEVGGES